MTKARISRDVVLWCAVAFSAGVAFGAWAMRLLKPGDLATVVLALPVLVFLFGRLVAHRRAGKRAGKVR